jgi:hypothetical protein
MPYDNQIPAMYVDWTNNGNYEMIIVDWRCEIDQVNRYWSLHNFIYGYAGFQNNDTFGRTVYFSMQDQSNLPAKGEYAMPGATSEHFITEGPGHRVFKDINWSDLTSYSMCIGVKTVADRTYFAQWYRDNSVATPQWVLVGIISYKQPNMVLQTTTAFQEDWNYNGDETSFSLTNAHGKDATTHNWNLLNSGKVQSVFCDGIWNKDPGRHCTYKVETIDGCKRIVIKSGKYVADEGTAGLPFNFTLSGLSNTVAEPQWNYVCWKVIKSLHSNLFIDKGTGLTVIQSNNHTVWGIRDAGNGYFYICKVNSNWAIAVNQTSPGSDLVLQTFQTGNDYQQWKFEGDSTTGFYIVPKVATTMGMTIQGAYYTSGALIQLWGQSSSALNMRWQLLSLDEL